jgi:hypothetical protein
MYSTAPASVHSVAEFRTFDATGTNMSLSGTMTASSYYSASYVSSKANDNSTATLWGSAATGLPHWLRADLGSTKTVDRVQIQWRTNGIQIPTAWRLQISSNGSGGGMRTTRTGT